MYENQFVIVKRLYIVWYGSLVSLYIRSPQNHTCSGFISIKQKIQNVT